jgi:hypothetical protein
MRQKTELEITLHAGTRGEAPSAGAEGTEARAAKTDIESRAAGWPSMEAIVERDNLRKALAQVKRNKGAPGIDGMTVGDLAPHLKKPWPTIRAQLLDGTYEPQPVRRVEIPKASGGKRPARYPDGARPLHPAGGVAGAAGGLGPDVLRAQLRLPAAALSASGGGSGAGVDRVRSRRRGGHRLGKVLRPGQPWHPDGVGGEAGG